MADLMFGTAIVLVQVALARRQRPAPGAAARAAGIDGGPRV